MALRLGEFVIDLETRELNRGGNAVHLSPKAFELLALLVTKRPKALSKRDLQDHLWPNTFVVEKNLSNLVSEIRTALGDDPSRSRFVRTVPRFGYAFLQPPTEQSSAVAPTRSRNVRFCLLWQDGRAALNDGQHVLGRDPDLPLFFDSPSVSRRHAVLRVAGTEATLEDLGSKNGTFVGSRRVESTVRLVDRDLVRIGSIELTFRALRTSRSTETEAQPK